LNEAKILEIPHDNSECLNKIFNQAEKDFCVSELINRIIRKKYELKFAFLPWGEKKGLEDCELLKNLIINFYDDTYLNTYEIQDFQMVIGDIGPPEFKDRRNSENTSAYFADFNGIILSEKFIKDVLLFFEKNPPDDLNDEVLAFVSDLKIALYAKLVVVLVIE